MAASARTSDRPAPGGQRYLVALGANRWHPRYGPPRRTLTAAVAALHAAGLTVVAMAPVIASRPLGPSQRTYANGAVLLDTDLAPPALLAQLQGIEAAFGRRRRGQRWGARVLDLDVVLWSGGRWIGPDLVIPHPEFRRRTFVLGPAAALAPCWRDPADGASLRQLHARLTAPRVLPKSRPRQRARAGP